MCWNALTRSFVAKPVPKSRIVTLLAVGVGGALGALGRVFLPWPTVLDEALQPIDPLPIMLVNLIGAALLGLFTGYATLRPWPEAVTKGITTGFFGAFTTMSALAVVTTGLALGQAALAMDKLTGIFTMVAIIAGLVVFLYITTMLTIGTIRLGTKLASGNA